MSERLDITWDMDRGECIWKSRKKLYRERQKAVICIKQFISLLFIFIYNFTYLLLILFSYAILKVKKTGINKNKKTAFSRDPLLLFPHTRGVILSKETFEAEWAGYSRISGGDPRAAHQCWTSMQLFPHSRG